MKLERSCTAPLSCVFLYPQCPHLRLCNVSVQVINTGFHNVTETCLRHIARASTHTHILSLSLSLSSFICLRMCRLSVHLTGCLAFSIKTDGMGGKRTNLLMNIYKQKLEARSVYRIERRSIYLREHSLLSMGYRVKFDSSLNLHDKLYAHRLQRDDRSVQN